MLWINWMCTLCHWDVNISLPITISEINPNINYSLHYLWCYYSENIHLFLSTFMGIVYLFIHLILNLALWLAFPNDMWVEWLCASSKFRPHEASHVSVCPSGSSWPPPWEKQVSRSCWLLSARATEWIHTKQTWVQTSGWCQTWSDLQSEAEPSCWALPRSDRPEPERNLTASLWSS